MKERKIAAFALLAAMWFIAAGARAQEYKFPIPEAEFIGAHTIITGMSCAFEQHFLMTTVEDARPTTEELLELPAIEQEIWREFLLLTGNRLDWLSDCIEVGQAQIDFAYERWGLTPDEMRDTATLISDALVNLVRDFD